MLKRKRIWLGIIAAICIFSLVILLLSPQGRSLLINRPSYPTCFSTIGTVITGEAPTIRLVEACRDGDLYLVKRLLEAGADPNYSYLGYFTPIEATYSKPLMFNRLDIAKLLVEYGADVTKYSAYNEAIFHEAKYLCQATPREENEIIKNIDYLLQNGASSIDSVNNTTLLHIAAEADSVKLAKLLIEEYGCDYRIEANGVTPMDAAVLAESKDVVAYFQQVEREAA